MPRITKKMLFAIEAVLDIAYHAGQNLSKAGKSHADRASHNGIWNKPYSIWCVTTF